jgi:small-conductance mechanosensitive channel
MSMAVVRSVMLVVIGALAAPAARAVPADSLVIAPDTSAAVASAPPSAITGDSAPAESTIAGPVAQPVFLGGHQIFVVRAPRKGLSPEARATAIRLRLDEAVKDLDTRADSVRLVRTRDGVEVRLGGHFLWMITPGDVAGVSVHDLANLVARLPSDITAGVLKERAGRRPLGILISALIALGVTLLAWILLRLLIAAGRRWRAYLALQLPKMLGGIRIGTFDIVSQRQLTDVVVAVLGRVGLVIGLLLIYGWATVVFSLFPWSQGWSWRLFSFAREEMVHGAVGFGHAIPAILALVFLAVLFHWLSKISDKFFEAIAAGTVRLDWIHPDVAAPTKRLVKILLWLIAAAIAWPFIPGTQSKAVQGFSILIGLMVSLGSSGIVGNMIAGLVLVYSRSFKIGERVKLGDHVGDIVSLGFFATKLRTPRNEEITLPNGLVAGQPIMNYTRLAQEKGLVLHTQVTISTAPSGEPCTSS